MLGWVGFDGSRTRVVWSKLGWYLCLITKGRDPKPQERSHHSELWGWEHPVVELFCCLRHRGSKLAHILSLATNNTMTQSTPLNRSNNSLTTAKLESCSGLQSSDFIPTEKLCRVLKVMSVLRHHKSLNQIEYLAKKDWDMNPSGDTCQTSTKPFEGFFHSCGSEKVHFWLVLAGASPVISSGHFSVFG